MELLKHLNYPLLNEFDINKDEHYNNLFLFLENNAIRLYNINERTNINKIDYLKAIDYPNDYNNRNKVMEWLLIYATTCIYSDNAGNYNKIHNEEEEEVADIELKKEDQQDNDIIMKDQIKNKHQSHP